MREMSASIGDLSRNDRMKMGQRSAGRIRGAMPPPRYRPPVESTVSARLPADAPYADTNTFERAGARRTAASSAAREIAAGRSSIGGIGVSAAH